MAKPNYAFAKRQRELEKKRKKEEKALQKKDPSQEVEVQDSAPMPATSAPASPEPK